MTWMVGEDSMERIPALHIDHYDLNMPYAWWKAGMSDQRVQFNVYFREHPFGNGFTVFAGLERIVHYLQGLRFTDEDIAYLRTRPEGYDAGFLDSLRGFRFRGNVDAVREGEIVFPEEPLLKVEGTVLEAALIEAAVLNVVNWHSPVATKAARMKQVAGDDPIIEMATRRMPEVDAAVWAARATYIAGVESTSNTYADMRFGVPAKGTMGHMWIQAFDSELEAFRKFVEAFPEGAVFLVDTYDTLRSGVPNAITVAKEMEAKGHRLLGIRLDSGDLAYLSIEARRMLDAAGLHYVKIFATNNLDEDLIANLKEQGAKIDVWGVGTRIASVGASLGAVYKMKARSVNGLTQPVIKVSDNFEKTTVPGDLVVYRLYDRETGMARGDYLALADEELPKEVELFHPVFTHRRKKVTDFEAQALLVPVFRDGELVYELPSLDEIRAYHKRQLGKFWPEYRRRLNPEIYPVSLSERLWTLREKMIAEQRERLQ